jgi:hypothetical protein
MVLAEGRVKVTEIPLYVPERVVHFRVRAEPNAFVKRLLRLQRSARTPQGDAEAEPEVRIRRKPSKTLTVKWDRPLVVARVHPSVRGPSP